MSNDPPSKTAAPSRTTSLRYWGILLLVMFLLTSAVGGSLALESSYLPITLASHIGLALVTLGLGIYANAVVARPYRALPHAFVGLGALSALGATISGTVFLLGGQSNPALYAMEGFAVAGIIGSVLTVVFGGVAGLRSPTVETN